MKEKIEEILKNGCEEMGLDLSEKQTDQFSDIMNPWWKKTRL